MKQSIIDQLDDERMPYNLWGFLIVELLILGGIEGCRLWLSPELSILLHPLFILIGLYVAFLIFSPYYKQPNFECHNSWIFVLGFGGIALIAGMYYQLHDWPSSENTLMTAVILLLLGHLMLAMMATIRKAEDFLTISPLWGLFLAMSFGLIALLHVIMDWKHAHNLTLAGFMFNATLALVFIGLMSYHWRRFKYLLYYLLRLLYCTWVCAEALFIKQSFEVQLPF